MRALRVVLLAAAFAVVLGPQGWASEYDAPINLPRGAKIDFTVQRSRSVGGMPAPLTMTFRYRQELTPTKDGYRVRQRMTGMDIPPEITGDERAQVEQTAAVAADLSYLADADLTPLRIEGWQGMIDRMSALIGGKDGRLRAAARQSLGSMTPEAAADTLMQEQTMAAAAQYTQLDLGKPLSDALQLPNPLGGSPIEATYSIQLESLDRAAGRAVIVTRQALDLEAASRGLKQATEILVRRAAQEGRTLLGPPSDFRIERTRDCRSIMDTVTGLALNTDCTQTIKTLDAQMQPDTQVDRWVITQALVGR